MKHIACNGIGLVLLLSLTGLRSGAQNQAPAAANSPSGASLGDYARQVRKDPAAASKPKVFDNDNLPREDKLSVIGQTPSTTEIPVQSDASATEAKAAPAVKMPDGTAGTGEKVSPAAGSAASADDATKQAGDKQWADKLAAQKDQIDLLTRELDVLQREYQIRAAAMYADAGNRMRNSTDWDKQDAKYKQDIADKQKALDDAKQKMEDMQEDARKAGVPSSVREP
ncbi:MAG TPA: hypothetical protein VGM18_07585 [Candidatus Sulfotelmatobacter sp.]|jgi:hypothetical protein